MKQSSCWELYLILSLGQNHKVFLNFDRKDFKKLKIIFNNYTRKLQNFNSTLVYSCIMQTFFGRAMIKAHLSNLWMKMKFSSPILPLLIFRAKFDLVSLQSIQIQHYRWYLYVDLIGVQVWHAALQSEGACSSSNTYLPPNYTCYLPKLSYKSGRMLWDSHEMQNHVIY